MSVVQHRFWIVLTLVCLAVVNASGQENVVETFGRVKSETIDAGVYTVHVLEIKNPESKFDDVTFSWMQIPTDEVQISMANIEMQGRVNGIYQHNSSGDELVVRKQLRKDERYL